MSLLPFLGLESDHCIDCQWRNKSIRFHYLHLCSKGKKKNLTGLERHEGK